LLSSSSQLAPGMVAKRTQLAGRRTTSRDFETRGCGGQGGVGVGLIGVRGEEFGADFFHFGGGDGIAAVAQALRT